MTNPVADRRYAGLRAEYAPDNRVVGLFDDIETEGLEARWTVRFDDPVTGKWQEWGQGPTPEIAFVRCLLAYCPDYVVDFPEYLNDGVEPECGSPREHRAHTYRVVTETETRWAHCGGRVVLR